jgi:hypothetical protein
MERYQQQIESRQFGKSLPPCLVAITSKQKEQKRKAEQHGDNQNYRNQRNNGEQNAVGNRPRRQNGTRTPLKNNNINEKWKLPPNKQFHNCFYGPDKRHTGVPKYDEKEFCIRFFVLGECAKVAECRFQHQDPREVGLESKFDTFCRTAYS